MENLAANWMSSNYLNVITGYTATNWSIEFNSILCGPRFFPSISYQLEHFLLQHLQAFTETYLLVVRKGFFADNAAFLAIFLNGT